MGFLQPSSPSLITELSPWELSLSIIVLSYLTGGSVPQALTSYLCITERILNKSHIRLPSLRPGPYSQSWQNPINFKSITLTHRYNKG